MIVAFLESIRYVGHLFPLAFFRFFLGYYYFTTSLENFHGEFLTKARLEDLVKQGYASGTLPAWYEKLLQILVTPHWTIFSYVILSLQMIIGISYLAGFLVRPMAVLGAIMGFHFSVMTHGSESTLYAGLAWVHLMMAWMGGGRCLGLDYFFYKRQRGIWW